jgi:hypothetical protein
MLYVESIIKEDDAIDWVETFRPVRFCLIEAVDDLVC